MAECFWGKENIIKWRHNGNENSLLAKLLQFTTEEGKKKSYNCAGITEKGKHVKRFGDKSS